MKRRRKTEAERRQERANADARQWDVFRAKLDAARNYKDALLVVHDAPSPDAPGRRFYSNLGFFLQAFTVPDGANSAELALYQQLIERMDEAGELKLGARAQVEQALRGRRLALGPF